MVSINQNSNKFNLIVNKLLLTILVGISMSIKNNKIINIFNDIF